MNATSTPTCIIGAGASGIAAAKVLHERGLPFDCFELGSGLGGNWRYQNDNGLSAAYRSLHINTNRDKMAYPGFPMPDHYPTFPHHSQILEYFEAYVDHFGFRDQITFQTEVMHVAEAEGGGYEVTLRARGGTPETRLYGQVIVANGHHWCPHQPEFPGTFTGTAMHAHGYHTPEGLAGQRVLIVGVGNSGCDIASEVCRVAERTLLSTRHGAHVIPKYILGRPLDDWTSAAGSYAPLWVQRLVFNTLLRLSRGPQEGYGFPTPDHKLLAAHPTVSNELLNLVGHGKVTVKPNLDRLQGDRVAFVDGTEERVDTIIYATGYQIAFPFLGPDLLPVQGDNEVHLYRFVVAPEKPGLYFLGLIQPLGAVMPLAALQAEWVADLMEGQAGLPDPSQMAAAIAQDRAVMAKRYVASKRHTIQVDYYPYERQLKKERRRKNGAGSPSA